MVTEPVSPPAGTAPPSSERPARPATACPLASFLGRRQSAPTQKGPGVGGCRPQSLETHPVWSELCSGLPAAGAASPAAAAPLPPDFGGPGWLVDWPGQPTAACPPHACAGVNVSQPSTRTVPERTNLTPRLLHTGIGALHIVALARPALPSSAPSAPSSAAATPSTAVVTAAGRVAGL